MKRILQKMKKEPREVRKVIVSVATLVVTGIVVLFWALTLPYQLGTSEGKKTALEDELKPISLLKDDLSAMVSEARSGIKTLKEEAGVTSESKEGEVLLYPME